MHSIDQSSLDKLNTQYAIGTELHFEEHTSGLICGIVATNECRARFFLLGAQVTDYQPSDHEHPVLFMSSQAIFEAGKAIRGGVPICFPWFGPAPKDSTAPSHGLVRTQVWHVISSRYADEELKVELELNIDPYRLRYIVSFGQTLDMRLVIRNEAMVAKQCEVALHSYFALGDVHSASVSGLEQLSHLDQLTGQTHSGAGDFIQFDQEVDRIYDGAVDRISIHDPAWNRKLILQPYQSQSTVVWNPWIAKSKRLADFGDEEYLRMCCVETANVGNRSLKIAANEKVEIGVRIGIDP